MFKIALGIKHIAAWLSEYVALLVQGVLSISSARSLWPSWSRRDALRLRIVFPSTLWCTLVCINSAQFPRMRYDDSFPFSLNLNVEVGTTTLSQQCLVKWPVTILRFFLHSLVHLTYSYCNYWGKVSNASNLMWEVPSPLLNFSFVELILATRNNSIKKNFDNCRINQMIRSLNLWSIFLLQL